MYIRHQGDAVDALAQILEMPERRQQIVQCTIKIMLCLDVEPRVSRAPVPPPLVWKHPGGAAGAGPPRAACVEVLRGARLTDPDSLHEEADLLFELFAISDERAAGLLEAIDRSPEDAVRQVMRLYEALDAVRSLAASAAAETRSRSAA